MQVDNTHPSTLCLISSQQQFANLIPSLFSRPLILSPHCLSSVSRAGWLESSLVLSLWHLLNYITYIKSLSAFVRSHELQSWFLYPIFSFMYDRLTWSFMYRFNTEISTLKMHWVEQSCQAVSVIITYITSLFKGKDSWPWSVLEMH